MSQQGMSVRAWLEGCLHMCRQNGFHPGNMEENHHIALTNFGIELTHALRAYDTQQYESLIMTLPHVADAGKTLCDDLEKDVGWKEVFQSLKSDIESFSANVPRIQETLRRLQPKKRTTQDIIEDILGEGIDNSEEA